MGATISSLGALLKENVESGAGDLIFRETDLINAIASYGGGMMGLNGASPFSWVVASGANASYEVFAEGQAPGASGQQTFKRATLGVFYARAVAGITGHARDNAIAGGFYEELPSLEEVLTQSDLMKGIEDSLCGSTQDIGISSIIDATDTYAGIAPASVSNWASLETAIGGGISMAALDDMFETLTSASVGGISRGASPSAILVHPKQARKYSALAGTAGGANNSVLVSPDGAKGLDLGFKWAAASYQGVPFVKVRTLANSELFMVEMEDFVLREHRKLQVDLIGGNPEMRDFAISTSVALQVRRRNKHGKMTGLT